jgi:hypothetical protein
MVACRHLGELRSLISPVPQEKPKCTRCGQPDRRVFAFPLETRARKAVLCAKCQGEWDDLLREVVRRWHEGLRICFFCGRSLGNHRFPAMSPFGASCGECGVKLSSLALA